jgi:hypothetical protein
MSNWTKVTRHIPITGSYDDNDVCSGSVKAGTVLTI